MATYRSDDSLVRVVFLVLGIIILLPLLMMAFAMPMMGMGWWGMGQFGGGFSPWWGVGMMLVWLAVLLAIGYLIYRAVAHGPVTNRDRALEELRHAYARGDLSDEEFERRRERLERSE
ncbi:SHOCT domain-containing protein [Halorarum salinum]|uniref:SHOCT domain-containing protein n=1 Tax=Halorarum salinum TaxID=2743089 RepID=A0A7D5QDQ4_9EURY|nr:SHOCT domain-containing protein [Halobaculum salinum]QLG62281.1 SHOCT domain-containing protein [Halobaculum salinum]